MLSHAVAPLLESAGKLRERPRAGGVRRHAANTFATCYDHLARINVALDAMRDTIGTAIQVNLSMVTIEESETTKRLAAWAGIFAVATAFAGIWGMNFEHMPELKWTYGYPVALGIIATRVPGCCSGASAAPAGCERHDRAHDRRPPRPRRSCSRACRHEEAQARRGKLKIFFGASAGVGKTYAMLSDARARAGSRASTW